MLRLAGVRDDWRFVVAIVSGGHFLSHFYILAFPPLFPLLRRDFGLSNTELGLIVSIISVATLLQPVVGEVVDRVGARAVFIAGVTVTSLGIVLAGLAGSYVALLAFTLVSGLGQSAFHPSDYALLDAAVDTRNQGKSFSVHTFGGYAGFAAAPVVVGTLALAFDWHLALVAVGVVGLAYAALATAALRPGVAPGRGATSSDEGVVTAPAPATGSLAVLLRPTILVLFAFFVVMTMTQSGVQTFTAILAVESYGLSEAIGNATLTSYLAFASVGILAGGVVADRWSPRRIIVSALLVAAVTTWVAVGGLFPVDPAAAIALFGVIGFASGVILPSRDRLVSESSATGSVGRSFGIVFTGISVGGLLAPVMLGAIIDVTASPVAFALIGGFFVLAAAIAYVTGTGLVGPGPSSAEEPA